MVLITSQCKSSGNSAQDRKWKSKEEGVVHLGVKLVSTTETLMAIHISGGSFEVQEMKEGTFFLSLALFLAFSLLSLSPLVWYLVSAVMHVSSEVEVQSDSRL